MIKALLSLVMASTFSENQAALLKEAGTVRVLYVSGDDDLLENKKSVAEAKRTSDGQKWIVINIDADQSDMDCWFLHELAHHIAWSRHGEDVELHGPEFQSICRQLVPRRKNYFCGG